MGDGLIRGTAILTVACYAVRVLIAAAGLRDDRWQRRARGVWTVGAAALLFHLICAFHFQHGWSHAAAWEHTRQRTLALTGWNSGVGLVANYAMVVMWLADVVGWQTRLDWPRTQRTWFWIVQIYFAFITVNATVVFGPRYWSAAGMIVVAAWNALRCGSPSRRG